MDKTPLQKLGIKAVAELAVIVLGVSIALWADAWADGRKERRTERARLVALKVNVDTTLAELRSMRIEIEATSEALDRLLAIGNRRVPSDSVKEGISDGFTAVPNFKSQLSVYDDLKNSGELALLTDPKLRQSLSAMESTLKHLERSQADVETVQWLNVDRYLIEEMDVYSMFPPEDRSENAEQARTMALQFLTDRKFRNIVMLKMDVVGELRRAAAKAESDLVAVQQAIAAQLSKPR